MFFGLSFHTVHYYLHYSAQAIHNMQLCMDYLSAHIPLFPSLDYSAEDIVSGEVSLWRLLDVVFEMCRGRGRGRGVGRGSGRGGGRGSGGGGKGRSVSPGAGEYHCVFCGQYYCCVL